MSKKCKCNCVDECCEGKKNFFWLIPVVLLVVTGFGLFGPKKIRKSGFGRVLKIILAFLCSCADHCGTVEVLNEHGL